MARSQSAERTGGGTRPWPWFADSPRKVFFAAASQAWAVRAVALVLLLSVGISTAAAQDDSRAVPRQDYFLALNLYRDGEFATALQGFRAAGGGGIRSTEGRWVDSICYYAMIGECHYQLGDLPAALESFDAAAELLLAHRHWLLRIEFPPALEAETRVASPPVEWAVSGRRMVPARIPAKLLSKQGNPNVEQAVLRGGVVAPPEFYPLHVSEIVRCAALALRRRAELLGPTGPHFPLSPQLVAALAQRPAPPNHWSQSWVGVLLGLAYLADGKPVQAVSELRQSLLMGGQFDHGLTGIAFLELGKLAARQGQRDAAATYLLEASLSAAAFEQYEVVGEALEQAAVNHLVRGQPDVPGSLAGASEWSRRTSDWLEAQLLLALAEQLAMRKDSQRAGVVLARARGLIARSEMKAGRVGADALYLSALLAFQQGQVGAGETSLSAALAFERQASPWLFQIQLADRLYTSGNLSPRVAEELYAEVLREPDGNDWVTHTAQTLAVQLTPHPLPFEHWFQVALERKQLDRALEIADAARRHRFHATLPLGGRLLALRWILEAPPRLLTPTALLQRRDLIQKYPEYAEVSRRSRQLLGQLAARPLRTEGDEAAEQQVLYAQLAEVATIQERMLREIAVRREASEYVFPPLRPLQAVRQELRPGQRVLAFFQTSRGLHAFSFDREDYQHWQVAAPERLTAQVTGMLKLLGNHDKQSVLGGEELRDDGWREASRTLLRSLLGDDHQKLLENVDQLVVVPDGVTWYVPFGALCTGDSRQPLIARTSVRAVPTVSLAVPDGRGVRPRVDTGVVVGRLLGQDEPLLAKAAADLAGVLPGVVPLNDRLPAPSSLFAARCSRLVVFDALEDLQRGVYQWAPLPLDRGKPGSRLADWWNLPWGGAEQLVLPGFHSPAENSLKHGGSGEELFLTTCGLMASGARTILLSRWRVGGQSTIELTREFVQELPHLEAAAAWQRSVLLSMRQEVDSRREPRLKSFTAERRLLADHPFFWSGYLLVDTGHAPRDDDAAPPEDHPGAAAVAVPAD